jgi:hypothetical protein
MSALSDEELSKLVARLRERAQTPSRRSGDIALPRAVDVPAVAKTGLRIVDPVVGMLAEELLLRGDPRSPRDVQRTVDGSWGIAYWEVDESWMPPVIWDVHKT